ncbi:hypothetical protein ACWDA3_58235 [Nonomuraea rubra]
MTADSDRQIRELLETRTLAFGRRDAATAAAGYDDDLVLYDDGTEVGMWVLATSCLRRQAGSSDIVDPFVGCAASGGSGAGHLVKRVRRLVGR